MALSAGLGGVGPLGGQHVLLGVAGYQQTAAREGHELGDLFIEGLG